MAQETIKEWLDGVISDDDFYAMKAAEEADAWDEETDMYDRDAYMGEVMWG